MIRSSLEFAPGTTEATKKLVMSFPPYDLLVAYRRAARELNTTDVVVLIAVYDDEPIAFEVKSRTTYIEEAFNQTAKAVHPIARRSAHSVMKLPRDSAAFWLVIEIRDKGGVVMCAIGEVRLQEEAVLD